MATLGSSIGPLKLEVSAWGWGREWVRPRTLELPSSWETGQSCVYLWGAEGTANSVPPDNSAEPQTWQGRVWVCISTRLPQRSELPRQEGKEMWAKGR